MSETLYGELYRENMKKAKIDINEFLVQCRVNGYFDVSKLVTCIDIMYGLDLQSSI